MNPSDRFARVEELFHRALERTGEDRRAFLERECPDPQMRAEVERLVESDASGWPAGAPAAERLLDDPKPGESVGPYRLVRILGAGGMGVIWEAEQLEPVRRTVALKLVKLGMDTREVLARFDLERQALAVMDHPGIARVFDAGATPSGRPYFVMQLVRGRPLIEYCDGQRLDIERRLGLFLRVCRAVQHAHQKGVIHRDLKPSNILVEDHEGHAVPKIIDFGIAKVIEPGFDAARHETRLGARVGTPEYMSPEQAAGDPAGLDTRSDVYSLGVILYELLTGSLPHRGGGTPEQVAAAIVNEDAPPPSRRIGADRGSSPDAPRLRGGDAAALARRLRGDLDRIVLKALEKDRSRRYPSAADLAADLERHLRHEPVSAAPPRASYRLRKFVRRHRLGVAVGGAALAALLVAMAGAGYGHVQTLRAEREGKARLYESLVGQLRLGREAPRVGQRPEALAAAAEAMVLLRELELGPDSAREVRDLAIAALARPDVREVRRVPAMSAGWSSGAADPTLTLFALGGEGGALTVRRLADDVEILGETAGSGPSLAHLDFSPTGRHLALLRDPDRPGAGYDATLLDLETRRPVLAAREVLALPVFDPRTGRAAFCHLDGTVRVHDLSSGAVKETIEVGGAPWAEFLADGRIACGDRLQPSFRVVGGPGGRVETRRPAPDSGQGVTALAEHPTGRYLAIALGPRILVWDRAHPEGESRSLAGARATVTSLSFHPERGLLLASGYDSVWRLWDARTGQELFHAPGHAARFSRSGREIVHQHAGEIVVLEWREGPALRTLRDGSDPASHWTPWISFDPTGTLLASTRWNGVALWHVPAGRELTVLPFEAPVATLIEAGQVLASNRTDLLAWPIRRDSATEPPVASAPRRLPLPAGSSPAGLCGTPDGRLRAVVLDAAEGIVRIEETATGQSVLLRGHRGVTWPALSPDGRFAATGPWNAPSVIVWDARTGRRLAELEGARVMRSPLAFSPDGRWLVTSTDRREVSLWSVGDWRRAASVAEAAGERGSLPAAVAFSPDGSLLAMVDSAKAAVRLLDLSRDLAPHATLEMQGVRMLNQIAFSPDGRFLALSDETPQIHLWDLHALRGELTLTGIEF